MRRRGLLACFACVGALAALAPGCRHRRATKQEALPPRGDPALGALLERIREEARVPGLAAAVVHGDGSLVTAAAGRRRVDEDAPLEPSDRFHLGSNTKAMTAFVVARFVERGQLRWDTTLAEAFPEWSGSMDPAYRAATIRDLLRHRAGLAPMMREDRWLYRGVLFWEALQSLPAQRRVVARNALHRPPSAPLGTFRYSNAGYVVAGVLLERITGKPWEQVIREELFAPLGMASCGFGQPAHGAERGQPFGHVLEGEEWAPTDGDVPALLGPSGTVTCTLADWARFVRANMKDPPRPLVGEATVALLLEPVATDTYPDGSPTGPDRIGYAMGWMTWDAPSERVVFHVGSNDRNFAAVRIFPARGIAFLAAVDAGGERAALAARRAVEALAAMDR